MKISLLFTIGFHFLVISSFQAQTCCDKLRTAGIESFAKGNYTDAIKKWEAAKTCATKCTTNDLDSWIQKANDKLKPPAKTEPKPKPKPISPPVKEPTMILVKGSPSGDYYIGQKEVTVAEFKVFVDATKYQTDNEKGTQFAIWDWKNNKPDYKKDININWRCNVSGAKRPTSEYNHPVLFVSKKDAEAYAAWLSKKTGKTYRLPTEAEWTFAASGGEKKSRQLDFYGSDDLNAVAWYQENAGNTTHPVGQKKPNELGLYDMNGNVWEWCSDRYPGREEYIARGGGWTGGAEYCLPNNRAYGIANSTSFIGFRLVRE